MRIGLDFGHGGTDSGAIGTSGLREKDVTLSIGLRLADTLKQQGFNIVLTRTTDKAVSLIDRSNMLNAAKVDLVVSLHVNSVADSKPNYVSSFIIARGGQAEKAAKVIQSELQTATGWPKSASADGVMVQNLHMTRETQAPAVLVEMGFISNPAQEKQLKDKDFQGILATSITKGICKFAGVGYKQTAINKAGEVKVVAGKKEFAGTLIDGKTYVHVRVLEELGLPVHWDDSTRTVYVGAMPEIKLPKHEKLANCDVITVKPEQLKVSIIKGKLNADGINGGYFDSTLSPLGLVITDGNTRTSKLSYKPTRAVFCLSNGKASIIKTDVVNANHALGAGPVLLPTVATDEGFQDDIMLSSRQRSAVGITADGLVKLVATDSMTLQQLSKLMQSLGCVQAMNLDGGGSSQMRYDGKIIRTGDGRSLSTAILLK
jgi:N-acetylmuramoyl-L-alanine amidase